MSIVKTPNDNEAQTYFSIEGNTITISGKEWQTTTRINYDEYIVEQIGYDHTVRSETDLQYQGGNLTKYTRTNTDEEYADEYTKHTIEYKYYNKKTPFHNDKTPK
jgi:hypothetical protein